MIDEAIQDITKRNNTFDALNVLKSLVQLEQYVGELIAIDFDSALLQIHDNEKNAVGGIPSLSFLIATRINPNNELQHDHEDTEVILLRVTGSSPLHNHQEAQRIRTETAQRISGEVSKNWDGPEAMDVNTKVYLGYNGIKCRVLGTFYVDTKLCYGSDIANFYPNRGLKIYKPNADALKVIANFVDKDNLKKLYEDLGISNIDEINPVQIGEIRYASTVREHQNTLGVPFSIYPIDLLNQKSALFGMTRTGKSNTTKIIAKSVFELRDSRHPLRIGQLIFDPNGEYANENAQDTDENNNPNALKNIYKLVNGSQKDKEVVTYGITEHPNDPDREMMLINFYADENLQIGKEIINDFLASQPATYYKNFVQVSFAHTPDQNNRGEITRHKRRILAYRSLLLKAGFGIANEEYDIKGLFKKELRNALKSAGEDNSEYTQAAEILSEESSTLSKIAFAFKSLDTFIREGKTGYNDFDNKYIQTSSSGESWADEDFKKIIGMFQYPNGTRVIGEARAYHSDETKGDYSENIYDDLKKGKLVIIDQSSGTPEINQSASDRIMTKIFKSHQKMFTDGEENIPYVLTYIEEAHNLLPNKSNSELTNIWSRTAKEGGKYRIGMVYATQEVSSIQKNILSNTANWFISHLNNSDETRELNKYYDFADFEMSIRKAQDKGFLRIKTLSSPFVVPVQVDKFQLRG